MHKLNWFGMGPIGLILSACMIFTIVFNISALKDMYDAKHAKKSQSAILNIESTKENSLKKVKIYSTSVSSLDIRSTSKHKVTEMSENKMELGSTEGNEQLKYQEKVKVETKLGKEINEQKKDKILNSDIAETEKVIVVPGNGSIMTRLAKLNQMLSEVRRKLLSKARFKEMSFPLTQPQRIQSRRLDFMEKFMQLEGVTTLILPIIKPQQSAELAKQIPDICRSIPSNNPNTMLGSFYKWHADEALCLEKLRPNSRRSHTWWTMCRRPLEEMFKPQPFDNMFPDRRPWDAIDPSAPEAQHSVTYINILDDVFLTEDGMIISRNYSVIAHFQFQQNLEENIEVFGPTTPTYDEVFLITQRFSRHFFHKNIEIVPRLSPYLEFLRKHPTVVIHIGPGAKFVDRWYKWFHISQNRFVQGRVRARLLYIPESSPMEPSLTLGLQMAAHIYEKGAIKDFGWKKRDMVIMIRRTHRKRFIVEHEQIKIYLEDLAKKHGLNFVEFRDDPTPSFEDSVQIFQRAVLVLAPHGAGLSNVVFSRPGTYVVEVVCESPKSSICMLPMCYNLGHRYYGISAIGTQCPAKINAPVKHIQEVLTLLMPHAVELKDADHKCKNK